MLKGFKRIFVVTVLLVALTGIGVAADLSGSWSGNLEMPGAELMLVFNITSEADGAWAGTLDVPAQGAIGIPIGAIGLEGDQVVFDVELISGVFQGELGSDGESIVGIWEQGGMQIPITLERSIAEFAGPNRPQEPQPPYPYSEIEVVYPNPEADIELAGTLTLPQGTGPFPVVLLISGSGPQDRNEELYGHKPFLVLADHLTRRGIAVLRVDDRGVAQSTGDFDAATTVDFTSDALAGVEYLKSRPEIDKERIGLIGHSEGGLIAPLAATASSDVAFIVLMAGPALNGEEIAYLQSDLLLRASGAPEELIAEQAIMQRELFSVAKVTEDPEEAAEKMLAIMLAPYAELSPEEFAALGDLENAMLAQINLFLSPWFQFFMTYDPLPTLRKVECPVLAINGSKDLQVPAEQNLTLIEAALQAGGNQNFTVIELPELNHLFQTAGTGGTDEYYLIEETIAPIALDTMADWLVEITGVN